MKNNEIIKNNETQSKTIRFDKSLIDKIDEMRQRTERNFSQRVQWMLKQYIEIIEKSKQ